MYVHIHNICPEKHAGFTMFQRMIITCVWTWDVRSSIFDNSENPPLGMWVSHGAVSFREPQFSKPSIFDNSENPPLSMWVSEDPCRICIYVYMYR